MNAGYNVTVFDTFFFGEQSLKDINDQIEIIKGDIRTMEPRVLEGVDVVIDLAALSNDPAGELDSRLTYSINHLGRVHVAKLSKKKGVKKYIAPSSAGNYGVSKDWVNEKSPVNPITTYTRANSAWEEDILPLADRAFSITILRQSTVYGVSPKMRFDIIVNDFTMQVFRDKKIKIKGNGMEYRPFVHMKDDCQAFIKVIEAEDELVNKEIFNVGSNDQSVQVRTVMKKVFNALGIEPAYEFGELIDKRDYKMSCDKITKTLGFRPKYKIEDGVKEVYKALQDGILKYDDPKTITVKWYKGLIEKGILTLK